jgi:amidase
VAGVITSNDITGWNALTLSKNIKAKTVSCLEVMRAYLDHIEKTNPEVNAIVALQDHEELLSQAKTKDEELAGGSYNGWMHGFPHAAKDLALTLGIKTTLGSPLLKDYVPDVDQLIIERIKNEGAIIIGKTNVPEFGLGCQTFNSVYGTTSNPYDQAKTSGGSSGGAAVALALNMLPVADGSDFAGSLRNPASFNNVVGFRPSMGRVPYFPTNEVWSAPMGTEGPMARNVNDVAMLLSTMAGYDSRYPLSLKEDPNVFSNDLEADFNGTKIGWLGDLGGYLPIETGILEMCEKALKSFEDLGCHVENARPTLLLGGRHG